MEERELKRETKASCRLCIAPCLLLFPLPLHPAGPSFFFPLSSCRSQSYPTTIIVHIPMRFFSPLVLLSIALLQLQSSTIAHGRLLLYTEPDCQGEAVHLPCTKSFGGEHKCQGGTFRSFHVPHLSKDDTNPKSKLPRLSATVSYLSLPRHAESMGR
jgi:hypothetical protein